MLTDLLSSSIEFLITTIGVLGYAGIFILMALESSIIPVPSEAVLIPAGVLIARGEQSALGVFIVATAGALVGSLLSYYIALALGRRALNRGVEKYGKMLFLTKESLMKTERFFESHGQITIFISRLIPVIRHIISLPAGFARMNLWKFSLYTLLGAGIWNVALIYLGYVFGQNMEVIRENLDVITLWIFLMCGIIVLLYILAHTLKKTKNAQE